MIKQKEYLLNHGSGEQDKTDSMSDAIDEWIHVQDKRTRRDAARKAAQGAAEAETEHSQACRESRFQTWTKKDALADGQAPSPRLADGQETDPDPDSVDDNDDETDTASSVTLSRTPSRAASCVILTFVALSLLSNSRANLEISSSNLQVTIHILACHTNNKSVM
ncbi:hypothetical protein VC83_08268 [Pseudogymnoascus destructans]|uniref:Uncharacterized protein n=1 Tax=Pseudogymnoascus destructans TaxID=655981 RepID=A0A176ZZV8_9PEZI|nr:uncharacterized protein VC83_08268 [Pseudogymnoascus destructans]OAF55456.1 hypothetical protein VC83_08268 [Pseudogymnoascus destructans]